MPLAEIMDRLAVDKKLHRGYVSDTQVPTPYMERELFNDNLLVRIHLITVMIRWTGFAP